MSLALDVLATTSSAMGGVLYVNSTPSSLLRQVSIAALLVGILVGLVTNQLWTLTPVGLLTAFLLYKRVRQTINKKKIDTKVANAERLAEEREAEVEGVLRRVERDPNLHAHIPRQKVLEYIPGSLPDIYSQLADFLSISEFQTNVFGEKNELARELNRDFLPKKNFVLQTRSNARLKAITAWRKKIEEYTRANGKTPELEKYLETMKGAARLGG